MSLGRALLFAYGRGKAGKVLHTYVVYGHTWGHTDQWAANRTSAIIQNCLDDHALRPEGACLIVGDVNADPADVPAIKCTLQQGWSDLGAQADQWGQPPCAYTCLAQQALQPTRRDYAFANATAIQLVSFFGSLWATSVPLMEP